MKPMLVFAKTRPNTARQPIPSGSRRTVRSPYDRRTSISTTRIAPTRTPVMSPSRLAWNQMLKRSAPMTPSWRARRAQSSWRVAPAPFALGEELEQADFRARQSSPAPWPLDATQRVAGILLDRLEQRRMDIGLAAYRGRIPQR